MTEQVFEEDAEQQPDDRLDQRKAFTEERRAGIFSTDVAAVLGLSRYGTPLSVYLAKRGESAPRDMSLSAWVGLRLENLVAEMYSAATGNRVRSDNLAHFHKEHKWFGAHLDRRMVGDPDLVVELKTRSSTRGWGEDGSSDIPPDVWCQVQAQLFVVGAREAHVAVLFSNSAFKVYTALPDAAFIEALLPTLEQFWFQNVQAGVPPEPTGHDADTDIVRQMGGGVAGLMRSATAEQNEVVDQYKLARYNRAQAQSVEQGYRNRIALNFIGPDFDGLTGPWGQILYRRSRDGVKFEWKLIAGVYRRAAERLLEMAAPDEDDAVVTELALIQAAVENAESLYSDTRPGSRRFLPQFAEE